MKIFDTHTHVFPDKIAARAIEGLREKSKGIPAYTKGTFQDLELRAREAGYSGWMNCPVATRPGQAKSLNEWAAEHNKWPSLSLGGLHPQDEDLPGLLHHLKDLGLQGLKLHPEYQEFSVLEERMEPVWNTCEELGLPVLFHAGHDIGFEPPYHSCPGDFAELARRHQGLVIVAAHTGGWLCWDEVERDLVGSRVYIDTSFSMPFMKDKEQFKRIVRNHGTDKVLFGTDSPWQDLRSAVEDVKSLGFSPEELAAIFWHNAGKVWKNVPELRQ